MSILSGFKSFERYLKVPTDDGNKYQLVSERTLARDIVVDKTYTQEEYDALTDKDSTKIYIIVD